MATTIDEYRKNVEMDAALKRRFHPVLVAKPSVDDTIDILRGLKDRYEGSHRVKITEEALIAVTEVSDRYVTDRFLPDKAIDLMHQASSRGLPPSAVWKGFEREGKPKKREPASGPRTLSEAPEPSGAAATAPRAARTS
jgi:ATP-dependent Clp protease ATP-binding subunit ClpC